MGENFEKELFIDRELSWIDFNRRVLFETFDKDNPLFERLKFMSIYFSNLDEFFMVRVGSLRESAENFPDKIDAKTGWTTKKQLKEIYKKVELMAPLLEKGYKELHKDLKSENIDILDFENLSKVEQLMIEKYFEEEIAPVLSPQIIDRNHPFPFLKNKEIYVIAMLETKHEKHEKHEKHDEYKIGIIPTSIKDSYFTFNIDNKKKIAFVSDIVKFLVKKLFSKYEVKEVHKLRVTRNADITIDEAVLDSDSENNDVDFRGIMETMLKKRRSLAPVRVQTCSELSEKMKKFLCDKLHCEENIFFTEKLPLDFSFGFSLYKTLKLNDKKLLFTENKAVKCINTGKGQLMKYIEEKDLLFNVPFQSFSTFVDLLYEAADNPDVISIKISLYRLASHSKVVSALAYAAERGKEVLCLLELRARFDEQSNIDYSKILEDAGCTVIYGLSDYKVHAKICLITKRHHNKISYITQVGTGNYNEKTSEQYTDMSYITSNEAIGNDANDLFKAFCLGEVVEHTRSLWIAPNCFKPNVISAIDDEIKRHKLDGDGFIAIKINSMNDIDIMKKLVEASCAGVKIELYIRGICCMKAGVPGLTENITIKSIVGKYLEHSRILCFGKDGREKIFIGSGDFLNRNTRRRVEVFVPVTSFEAKKVILKILDFCRNDNKKGWYMQSDGSYIKRELSKNDVVINSQSELERFFVGSEINFTKKKSFIEKVKELFG